MEENNNFDENWPWSSIVATIVFALAATMLMICSVTAIVYYIHDDTINHPWNLVKVAVACVIIMVGLFKKVFKLD